MKKNKNSTFPRMLMIITVLAVLLGLAGGMPVTTASAQQASYIIQAANSELAAQLVLAHGGEITSRLDIIHAVAANLSADEVALLRLEQGILAITPNSPVNSSGGKKPGDEKKDKDKDEDKDKDKDKDKDEDEDKDENKDKNKNKDVPSSDYPNVVGANDVWAQGIFGSGVTVAVLDTGLGNMGQLNKNMEGKPGRIVGWKDFIDPKNKKPTDPNGHGTHIAGIIANTEKGADGEWNGIAPGVNLVGVRVLNEQGAGTYETVIAGLQWIVANQALYNIRVINVSLVAPVQSAYFADPLNQAITAAWASGLTVIVAAGNSGPGPLSITVPGNNPYVVTVGAFTDNFTPADWSDDYIAPFSAAGPTLDGFVKPDLVAPGAHMVSIVPKKSLLTDQFPANKIKDNYFQLAGTSQATATVSGIAALVISQNPGLTPDQVKMRLVQTAMTWLDMTSTTALYSMFQQGTGRANAPDAVFAEVAGSANIGMNAAGDLAGSHYEGYAYYDEITDPNKPLYRLHIDGEDALVDWGEGYGTWDGRYGAWSGRYGAWSGRYGAWSGRYGAWSGSDTAWAGRYGAWSGRYGAWSGRYGAWSGGYTAWAGRYGAWSGRYGAWSGSVYEDPTFMANFASGASPNVSISNATISIFLLEP